MKPLSQLELASPFIISALIIIVSACIVPEIIDKLREHFTDGWTEAEIKAVDPERSPATHAAASAWAIDLAQIPTVVGTPVASLVILRSTFGFGFMLAYSAVFVGGLVFFVYFRRSVQILRYTRRGVVIAGFRLSPLVLGGLAFNAVAGLLAAFVVH